MDLFHFNTDTITEIDVNYDDIEYITVPSHINTNKVVDIDAKTIISPLIQEIILPNTLERISSLFFDNCPSLKKLVFQDKLTTIDKLLFNNCPNIKEIIFPESVTQIDLLIFENCQSLKSITALSKNITINSIKITNCESLHDMSYNLYDILSPELFQKLVCQKLDDWCNTSELKRTSIINFTRTCETSIKMELLSKYPFY